MLHTFIVCLLGVTCVIAAGEDDSKALKAPTTTGTQSFTFVQMCDTQLGMGGYEHDVANFRAAVTQINRLAPDFVVICGDLVDKVTTESFADFTSIKSGFRIPCHCAPGNHDVGNVPSAQTLHIYRKTIGADYFAFDHRGFKVIIANTQLWKAPLAPDSERHDRWFQRTVKEAHERQSPIIVVTHYPPFVEQPDEPEGYFNLPPAKRGELLNLLRTHGGVAFLSGHTHRHLAHQYHGIQIVTGETTSKNFDNRPMGFRLWRVDPRGVLTHEFVALSD